ncbi:MAG: fibronectin type III domain-containing protein [Flavitalea sp.]
MTRTSLTALILIGVLSSAYSQNVYNTADTLVRYDVSKPYGSLQKPDTNKLGLQKFVSTPTNGVTLGTDKYDATSFKAYFMNLTGSKMAFRMKFPKSFNNPDSAAKKYPIMIFLHGAGEVGCPTNNGIYNNEKPLWLGGKVFMDRVDNNQFDGFLLYPQLVNSQGCWGAWGSAPSGNFRAVLAMVDSMIKYVRADIDRLLITGLSGGGYGAWRMADNYPQRVAKIIPSAAAGSTGNRNAFVHIPIWFATGGKDPDPSPATAQNTLTKMKEIGADIRYTLYPDLGHAVWSAHWKEPDYVAAMNDMHKANPLIFFQRNEFCENDIITAKLGITAGFYAYEWQKDGSIIATTTGTTNTIVQPLVVSTYTGNEISIKAFGSYSVRFKRTSSSAWSVLSPKPAVIKIKGVTETPPITISGAKSNVLPSIDGNTTVPLQLPAGFINYEWYRVSDNTLVASTQVYNAPVGVYKARYSVQYGCGSSFSPDYTVVDATATPKPDAPLNLTASPVSGTSVKLTWSQVATPVSNETGFEIYRASQSGGPYSFVTSTAANSITYQDTGLVANSIYYYVVRAVNATGASEITNETPSKTIIDNIPPTAPSNLQYISGTSTTASLTWAAATDAGGIKRYDIYANNIKMFSTTLLAFTVTNLDSSKTYAYTIKAVDKTGNVSSSSNQVTAFTLHTGINYKYYTGSWKTLPDFNALTVAKSGVTDSVNINNTSIKTATTAYGFLWQGYIFIPVAATYTFETVSDDGSKLYIDVPYTNTATPLVSNDGVHGAISKTGTITLTPGYHPIAITYFQGVYGYGMQLFWSSNAGLVRAAIPKSFFTFEDPSSNAAPALPTALAATTVAFNKIRLNWTDNSTNETGFEITRSLTSNGTFVPIGNTTANQVSYLDSGLTGSKAYFYKIRAVGPGSESPYTAQVTATTSAAPATPEAPSSLAAFGAQSTVTLTWNDNSTNETNFRIFRSTDGVDYAQTGIVVANANAFTDVSVVAGTIYYYYVAGSNASGTGAGSNIVQSLSGNVAPVISGLSDLSLKSDGTVTQDFTATDDPDNLVYVSIPNAPAFIKLTNISGSNYRITATGSVNYIGWYPLTVVATDNFGKSSSVNVSVSISDKNTRSVFIKVGPTASGAAPLPWNNWLGTRTANNTFAALKDENNTATPFSVTSVNAWSTTTILGHITGDNSGVLPDTILKSGIADNLTARQLKFSGLNPEKLYNLVFVGSQNEGPLATTEYAVGTQKSVIDARYNTTRSANINSLVPDGAGQLLVNITRADTSKYSYLNGIVIEEYDPSIALLNPNKLYAEILDRTSAKITWADRTNNEDADGGYELMRATDSLFALNVVTIALPGNTTSYTNTGLISNTRYWYRVRAKNGGNYSEFSNQARVVTPNSIIYVNFNTTSANAAAPWINMGAAPMTVFTWANLKNQSNQFTGIGIKLEKPFNGEFTAGMNTGNNSGVVPDNVLISEYWLDNTQQSSFRLTGLNHSRRYRIGFTGSSGPNGWFKGNYTATYTINDKTVYLNSWMNTSKIVYIDDVAPDANGEMLLSFSTTSNADFGFNAGVIIQEYTDLQEDGSLPPSNLTLLDDTLAATATNGVTHKIAAYPNPFRDIINIDFYNNNASDKITSEVYDLNGRLVRHQQYGNVSVGRNSLRVDGLNVASNTGVFIVVLKVNGRVVNTMKMLRAKK